MNTWLIWQEEQLSLAVGLTNNSTSAKSQSWGYLLLACRFNFIKNFTDRNICNRLECFRLRLINT
jgi:hypothetical protein